MKIFYLTSTFYPSIGGVEVGIHNLSINMNNLGHSVYIVCPWQARNIPNKSELPYELILLPPKFFYLVKFIDFLPVRLIYLIYFYILNKIYKPDFWHISMSYPAGFSFLPFAKIFNPNYLVRSVGVDIQLHKDTNYGYRLNKTINNLFKKNFKDFPNHIAASDCLVDEYKKLSVLKKNIYKIPNGVNLNRFKLIKKDYNINSKKYIKLIAVGRNDPKKNYVQLIHIFKKLQLKTDFKYKLSIVGSNVQSLKKHIEKKYIKYIKLIEPDSYNFNTKSNNFYDLPPNQIVKYYLNADLFVFTSLIESFGIVILEAMAAGLPIIAFDVLGINELVKNNFNGKLIKLNSESDFVDAIVSLTNNKDYKYMSKNSYELAINYDWKEIAKRYYNLYLKIIRNQ